MTHPSLIEWADKQVDWSRDALRRHARAQNFELSADEKSEVLRRVRMAAGIVDDAPCEHVPFASDDLEGGANDHPRTLLASLGPIKNLARLAPNQKMTFALDGITLIYGDNGTGKSGYCRVTKKICRSLTMDDLLGDVFAKGTKPPVEVEISYLKEGEDTVAKEVWKDGIPAPPSLSSISIFDSKNARLYVDAENKIGFLPREVGLLEQYAANCAVMDAQFDTEVKQLNQRIRVPLPAGYSTTGAVVALLARLAPKMRLPSTEEIRAAAVWTPEDKEALESLEKLLAQDPKVLADRCRRVAAILKGYAADATTIEAGLSKECATKLAHLVGQSKSTAAAAALAASEQFKNEPLKDAGLSPWRLMYDYAEKYVQSLGGEHACLSTKEGEPCPLCQQPLSAEGAARMQRFADFVAGTATKAAEAARAALDVEVSALKGVAIPKKRDVENALGDYRKLSAVAEKIATDVIGYLAAAETRRAALLVAIQSENFQEFGELPEPIAGRLDGESTSLELQAAQHDQAATTGGAQRVAERERLAQLRDRKKLSEEIETVLARLGDLEMAAKLTKCRELVNTGQVSKKITTLRRELFTTELEQRIQTEIENLDLKHLPFRVTDRSESGKSMFGVFLAAPVGIANNKVLSEGEQRALALACFLGEIGGDTTKNGIVIDDPVSSLDHVRIRRVARRIVDEAAKGRQVVVFTHNLLFFNEVSEAASQAAPQVPVAKRIVTKSDELGFGLISETDEPWIARKVADRITLLEGRLRSLSKRTDVAADEYRSAVKDFYTDLRETWERLVEEVLLGKVVERFNSDVKTQSLKGVVVEDNDYVKIYWAMKRASERSGHDMAVGRNVPAQKYDDMQADLKELSEYRSVINKRRKDTDQRRELLEKPPAARVLG